MSSVSRPPANISPLAHRHGSLLALLVFMSMVGGGCGLVVEAVLQPDHGFVERDPPARPDYSESEAWAALPHRADGADATPTGVVDGQGDAKVDVFFIHPTTWFGDEHWNQPLDDGTSSQRVDDRVMPNQASAFNGCCRVFAPRYRQATLWTFLAHEADSEQAMDLAYRDVRAAFERYLSRWNEGRPIIIASHSQGSFHGLRLLSELFDDRELQERLVAAYLVGIPIATDVFTRIIPHIPLCSTPNQTGCVATWSTYTGDAEPQARFKDLPTKVRYPEGYETMGTRTLVCVNPLSWRTDEEAVAATANLGAVRFVEGDESPSPFVGLVGAQCDEGLLRIGEPTSTDFKIVSLGRGNLHLHDYSLFFMNIRAGAMARSNAWLGAHPTETEHEP